MSKFRRTYKVKRTADNYFRVQKGEWYYGKCFKTFDDAERQALLMQAQDAQKTIDKVRTTLDDLGLVEYGAFYDAMSN